jgi:hypothetical protein
MKRCLVATRLLAMLNVVSRDVFTETAALGQGQAAGSRPGMLR